MSIKGFNINGSVEKYDYRSLDNLPGDTGLSEQAKRALLACFEQVAWIGTDGQTYYDALEEALYPQGYASVTNVFVGCHSTNEAITTAIGKPYNATIIADNGYSLTGATVSITMGGTSVTGYYSNGTISIPNVTGDIVISVSAVSAISSITAVFTQGSTVIYDSDSLDALRQHLVVTATYSDSTTAVVTDYTLSGTLEVGTSTITVGYGGKTATFTVTVTHDDSADWDYVWRYTDGLPPVSDWSYSIGGGSAGFVRSITNDGMQMGSKSGTNSTYKMDYAAPSVLSAGGGVAEFSFYIPSGTSMATSAKMYYFAIAIGNGTNGLRVKITKARGTTTAKFYLQEDSSDWYGGTAVANFSFDTPYIIRLEIDGTNLVGRIYINDSLVMDNIDLSTIDGAGNLIMYTGGVTDPNNTNIGLPITIQYVKIKYGVPESAVVA